jgi:hypothetical protein
MSVNVAQIWRAYIYLCDYAYFTECLFNNYRGKHCTSLFGRMTYELERVRKEVTMICYKVWIWYTGDIHEDCRSTLHLGNNLSICFRTQ